MSSFSNFLNSHRHNKDSGLPITHTRKGDKDNSIYGGSYHIPKEKVNQFYELYYDNVFVKKNKEYLTEIQNKDSGLMYIDLDFNYDKLARHHTVEDIENIIDSYLSIMKKYIQFSYEPFHVYVMERDNPYFNGSKNKDGLHIIFCLDIDRKIQQHIRKDAIQTIDLSKLPLINSIEDVFDESITNATVNLQLCGFMKPTFKPYEIKHGFYCHKRAY
jgi:hypothetical protein